MSDIKYVVAVDFEVSDRNLAGMAGSTTKLAGAWNKLGSEARDVGRGMADAFTGVIEKVGAVGLSLAKWGGAAAFAGAAYGVGVLNNELEKTTVSIGAVLNAQGQANGIEQGMAKAKGLVSSMRQDAKELPGEFGDLLGIFQSGVGAAGNAGLDAVKFEKLAAHAMAAGKALSVPLDQAGRELAMLLDGRAGAHNVFGSRLGITAASGFNDKSGGERVKVITDALGKFEPAIKAFGGTFDALSSTFVDNLKIFGTKATMPLFERVKGTLSEINRWFDANESTVNMWATRIGNGLAEAFDKGKKVVIEWWPAVSKFATNAYDAIVDAWRDAKPHIDAAADSLKRFLQDDGAIDKITNLLKLYAAVKVGGGVTDSLGGVASAALGVYNAKQLATMAGGGGTAATAAGGLSGGAIAGIAGAGAGIGVGTWAMFEAGAGRATEGVQQLGAAAIAAVGAISPLTLAGGFLVGLLSRDDGPQNEELANEGLSLIRSHRDLGLEGGRVQEILRLLAEQGDFASVKLMEFALRAVDAGDKLGAMMAAMPRTVLTPDPVDPGNYVPFGVDPLAEQAKKRRGKGGGGGGVMKVEITISSNQAPGQIARMVKDELLNLQRHPRSSSYARNWSAASQR